jgi:hypothetical protein
MMTKKKKIELNERIEQHSIGQGVDEDEMHIE